jgi:hypothetical protein
MSRYYIVLLGIAAVTIGVTSACFSIFGLSELFAGASTAIVIMASSLELAKFVSAGFLYRYWGHISVPIRVYLIAAVCVLMVITSTGIYGFLASAYQSSSLDWKTDFIKMKSLKEEDARLTAQVQEFRSFIDAIPANRISRKYEFQKVYDPKIEKIQKRQTEIQKLVSGLQIEVYTKQAKVGPVSYVAEAAHMEVDTLVKVLMLLFVTVFDPLAVCLVFCWNLTILLRDKYRGNEGKIAAHPMMGRLVDHRYRKSHLRKVG